MGGEEGPREGRREEFQANAIDICIPFKATWSGCCWSRPRAGRVQRQKLLPLLSAVAPSDIPSPLSLTHSLSLALTHALSVSVSCESVFLGCGAVLSLSLRISIELQPGRTAMGDRRWAMAAAAAMTATGFS